MWTILKEMEITDHLTCLLRNLYADQEATVKAAHGKRTGLKMGNEYIKAVYCHSAYLIYMQSTSFEMLDKCSDLVHWENLEGVGREGGGRGDRDGEHM